jgi:hypothetical protein
LSPSEKSSKGRAASDFAETAKVQSAGMPEKGHFVQIRKRRFCRAASTTSEA